MRPLNEWADCRNRSQAGQDVFVLTMHKWKKRGTFLEFGANDPVRHSNTALLSDEFGWIGMSVEIDGSYAPRWQERRPNDSFIVKDALEFDASLLDINRFDYLSIDLDPPEASLLVLRHALSWGQRFSVITFEHDAWRGSDHVRNESRLLMARAGYRLAVPNVSTHVHWPYMGPEPQPFEDWYVDPEVIDLERTI